MFRKSLYGFPLLFLLLSCAPPREDLEGPGELSLPELQDQPVAAYTLRWRDESGAELLPLRLLIESEGGQELLELAESEREIQLQLPQIELRLTLFRDRDDDAHFDACPFPAEPSHMEQADNFDNLFAQLKLQPRPGGEAELLLKRRLCGPGDLETGLSGVLQLPEEAPSAPLLLSLTPQEESDLQPFLIPLFPQGIQGVVPFELTELLPGAYQLNFFLDEDGDGLPSACGGELGGADRYFASLGSFEIRSGLIRALPEPLKLEPLLDCDETFTGIQGEIQAPVGDEGQLYISLSSQGEASEQLLALGERLPRRFTLTGLQEGRWSLLLWLDRDGDARFSPCDGLQAGLDRAYLYRELELLPGELLDVGILNLESRNCPGILTGLQGQLLAERELGPEGSGRPVRIALYPEEEGEARNLLLFENHWELAENTPFTQVGEVSPGAYWARIYLDTDRDGRFLSCETAAFKDRSSTELFFLEIVEGEMSDIGAWRLPSSSCSVPRAEVLPIFDLEAINILPPSLRFYIEERGGWSDDRALSEERRLILAPGDFRIIAYLEAGSIWESWSCDREGPEQPIAEIGLSLSEEQVQIEMPISFSHCLGSP